MREDEELDGDVHGDVDLQGTASLLASPIVPAPPHPGTPRVVRLVEDVEWTELHLAWVGSQSLATVSEAPPAVAALVGTLASTVADIHDAGLAHGRISPDHVLLGSGGAPVLTGLADVARADRVRLALDVSPRRALAAPRHAQPGTPHRSRT